MELRPNNNRSGGYYTTNDHDVFAGLQEIQASFNLLNFEGNFDGTVVIAAQPPSSAGAQVDLGTFTIDSLYGPQNVTATLFYPKYVWVNLGVVATLFTPGNDLVKFNSLLPSQQDAIANGANFYYGLGGSDTVTLPSEANYQEVVGNGKKLGWTDTAASTFYTQSQPNDTYNVTGTDGNYFIVEGAGTEFITINGNGSSTITAGSGTDTISITGTGTNTVSTGANLFAAGSGTQVLSISGGGSLTVSGTFNGSATIGNGSTLTLDGPGTGTGDIFFGASGTEKLVIGGTTMPTETISDFAPGDIIDLANVSYDGAKGVTLLDSSDDQLDVFENGNNYQLNFSSPLPPQPSRNSFTLSSDGNGGTDITLATNWFNSTPSLTGKSSFSAGQPSLQTSLIFRMTFTTPIRQR